MLRIKPGRYYCFADGQTIVAFRGPLERQRYVKELQHVRVARGGSQEKNVAVELAVMRGAQVIPAADWPKAYHCMVEETYRLTVLLLNSKLPCLKRRLAS